MKIAIDGPSGAGKSTIARAVANHFHLLHLDTGALYRALGFFALREGVPPKDEVAVRGLLRRAQVDVSLQGGLQHTLLNGEDVSGLIRTQEVSQAASDISTLADVRAAMTDLQRSISKARGVVMDGRDIGTYVLPDAPYKFFVTAADTERARRRFLELQQNGQPIAYADVLCQVRARDQQDENRAIAPLRRAQDAMLIDTTALTIEEAIAAVIAAINTKEAARPCSIPS